MYLSFIYVISFIHYIIQGTWELSWKEWIYRHSPSSEWLDNDMAILQNSIIPNVLYIFITHPHCRNEQIGNLSLKKSLISIRQPCIIHVKSIPFYLLRIFPELLNKSTGSEQMQNGHMQAYTYIHVYICLCIYAYISLIFTCQTPTTALQIKIVNITNGSTNAVTCSSLSSNQANTWNIQNITSIWI